MGAATQFANDNVVPIVSGVVAAVSGSVMSGMSSMGPSAAFAAEHGGELNPWKVPVAGAAGAVASQATEDVLANEAAYRRFKEECAEELYERRWTPLETYLKEALIGAIAGEAARRSGKVIQNSPLKRFWRKTDVAMTTEDVVETAGSRAYQTRVTTPKPKPGAKPSPTPPKRLS